MAEDDIEGLLARCGLGDRAAFARLYGQAGGKLYGVALRILGNRSDAEEAVQEAFVKIWHSAGRFQAGRGSAQGWLVSIARNQAIDALRARKAPARDISEMLDLADHGPDARGERARRRRPAADRDLPRRAAARPGAGGARRLCGGLELRGARPPLRRAAQHHADLAAPGADQPQGVPGVMTDAPDLPPDLPGDPDAALAGEYVLRLLDPEEAAACAAREARDPAFAALVAAWRADLEPLDAAYAEAAPPAGLERRSRRGCSARRRRCWRGSGGAPGSGGRRPAAAALAALWLATAAPRSAAARRAAGAAGLGARLVDSDVALLAVFEPEAAVLSINRTSGAAAPGRSLELWVIEGNDPPVSLGVLPTGRSPGCRCRASSPRASAPAPRSRSATSPRAGSPTGADHAADRRRPGQRHLILQRKLRTSNLAIFAASYAETSVSGRGTRLHQTSAKRSSARSISPISSARVSRSSPLMPTRRISLRQVRSPLILSSRLNQGSVSRVSGE